jgi:hypothetical protein
MKTYEKRRREGLKPSPRGLKESRGSTKLFQTEDIRTKLPSKNPRRAVIRPLDVNGFLEIVKSLVFSGRF